MNPEHELEQLSKELASFRKNRPSRRSRLPAAFWQRACALAVMLPLSRVAKVCALNSNKLRKKMNGVNAPAPLDTKIMRIAPVDISLSSFAKSSSTMTLRHSEASLIIETSDRALVLDCFSNFLGGQR